MITQSAVCERKKRLREATDAILCAYVQVPFCLTLCHFCCWAGKYEKKQVVGLKKYRQAYLSALKREITLRSQMAEERDKVDLEVIHFGGGTPSVLSVEELADVLSTLYQAYDILPGSVETVGIEIRPDSVDPAKLRGLHEAGFNRLSIGAQTFDAEVLRGVGRHLSPEDLFSCYDAARQAGFTDINIDLLYGVPGQTPEIVREDAQTVVRLAPEHIDTHPWKPVARDSDGCLMDGGWSREEKIEAARLHRHIFEEHGYINYNHRCFSRPGYENLMHLIEATYLLPPLSFGAGAEQRTGFPKTTTNIEEYLAEDFVPAYMQVEYPQVRIDAVPPAFTDYVIRQLLLPEGLWIPGFNRRHGCNVVARLKEGWEPDYFDAFRQGDIYIRSRLQIFGKLQGWLERGVITVDGEWLRLDPEYQINPETWVLYMQAC